MGNLTSTRQEHTRSTLGGSLWALPTTGTLSPRTGPREGNFLHLPNVLHGLVSPRSLLSPRTHRKLGRMRSPVAAISVSSDSLYEALYSLGEPTEEQQRSSCRFSSSTEFEYCPGAWQDGRYERVEQDELREEVCRLEPGSRRSVASKEKDILPTKIGRSVTPGTSSLLHISQFAETMY